MVLIVLEFGDRFKMIDVSRQVNYYFKVMMNFWCVYFCVIICYCRSVVSGMFKKMILCGLRGRLFDVLVVKRLGNKRKCVCCFYYGIVD